MKRSIFILILLLSLLFVSAQDEDISYSWDNETFYVVDSEGVEVTNGAVSGPGGINLGTDFNNGWFRYSKIGKSTQSWDKANYLVPAGDKEYFDKVILLDIFDLKLISHFENMRDKFRTEMRYYYDTYCDGTISFDEFYWGNYGVYTSSGTGCEIKESFPLRSTVKRNPLILPMDYQKIVEQTMWIYERTGKILVPFNFFKNQLAYQMALIEFKDETLTILPETSIMDYYSACVDENFYSVDLGSQSCGTYDLEGNYKAILVPGAKRWHCYGEGGVFNYDCTDSGYDTVETRCEKDEPLTQNDIYYGSNIAGMCREAASIQFYEETMRNYYPNFIGVSPKRVESYRYVQNERLDQREDAIRELIDGANNLDIADENELNAFSSGSWRISSAVKNELDPNAVKFVEEQNNWIGKSDFASVIPSSNTNPKAIFVKQLEYELELIDQERSARNYQFVVNPIQLTPLADYTEFKEKNCDEARKELDSLLSWAGKSLDTRGLTCPDVNALVDWLYNYLELTDLKEDIVAKKLI